MRAHETGVALANGHPAIDRHVLIQFGIRGVHSFKALRNSILIGLSNAFYAAKCCPFLKSW
jgi:hypothetical protein